MEKLDLYKALEVSKEASQDEIRRSYRRLARKYHPDANPGDRQAEERFKEIQHAYDVLSKPDKRRKYNRKRQVEFQRCPERCNHAGRGARRGGMRRVQGHRSGSRDYAADVSP